MNEIERYVQSVIHRIAPGMPGSARFESDLRTHLEERLQTGESESEAVSRMGGSEEVARGFLDSAQLELAKPNERLGGFLFEVGLGDAALAAFAVLAAWWLTPRMTVDPPLTLEALAAAAVIVSVLAAILYFPLFETLFGQTAGKRVFGIVVAKDTGERAGAGAAIVRRIPFFFDIWPFDAAFLLFTARRQRAFDLAAKTIVIRAEGRRTRRPWVLVAILWVTVLALGILTALIAGAFSN